MALLPPPQCLRRAYVASRVITDINSRLSLTPETLAAADRVWPGAKQWEVFDADRVSPRWAACQSDAGLVLVISGTSLIEHWVRHATATIADLAEEGPFKFNRYFYQATSYILYKFQNLGFQFRGEVCLYGHSLGGAVAEIIGLCIASTQLLPNMEVQTFGCPQLGPPPSRHIELPENWYRYMTTLDPVPSTPFFRITYNIIPNRIGRFLYNYLTQNPYVQTGKGVGLGLLGQLSSVEYSPLTDGGTTYERFAGGLEPVVYLRHHAAEYRTRLGFALSPNVVQFLTTPTPITIQFGRSTEHKEKCCPNIIALTGANGFFSSNIRSRPLYQQIPVYARPKPIKLGLGKWGVNWLNNIVAVGTTKSHAHVFAKRLMAFLRYQTSMISVDQAEMLASFSAFLLDASGDTDFRPLLIVT